ncbi:MAG TPA: acetamidase/formamidase family protein [Puia sp.]|jgi:amidase|nr:acetamidase/formamidase family protein [Puia sp.]
MKWKIFLVTLIWLQNGCAQNSSSFTDKEKPRPIEFTPVSFSNKFSLNVPNVLRIRSGDTVRTETIDALGFDKNGVRRNKGGNPLTGPFYIENALPGDVLKITLTKVSLNRPYAYTSQSFVSRSMPDSISKQFKKPHLVKWKLDIQNQVGWPDSSAEVYQHLQHFKIPLRPFLGCIGVAPEGGKNEILSFFQGSFGGNMDFKSVCQSSLIYLPVFHEGGFFYIGDGHAMQGEGEIAGNALETSLDIEFTVDLIKNGDLQLTTPRAEDADYIMSIGSADKLETALKVASADMLTWLQKDYHLSIGEATQVMSTGIEYQIAEIADPNVIVVAKIKKEILKQLGK